MISFRAALLFLVATVLSPAALAQCKAIVPDAQDGPTASPENHTILYEDADVRVLDVHSRPHTREAWHTHARPAVMYVDSQGAGRYMQPGEPDSKVRPKDDPNFTFRIFATEPESLHATENTGNVPFHAIRVEFKHPGCSLDANAPVTKPEPDDVAPPGSSVLLENGDVRVLDIPVPAHTKWSVKAHAWAGFLYDPRNGPTVFPDGAKKAFGESTIVPIAANEPYGMENATDSPSHIVRFELKHASHAAPQP